MNVVSLMFDVEDFSGTQVVTVQLGDHVLGVYNAHTRHERVAVESTTQALSEALVPFVDAAMARLGMDRVASQTDVLASERRDQ